jgi:RNA polymerase sigma-70 factor (ECF subfamily)
VKRTRTRRKDDEDVLVREAQTGNAEAFSSLVKLYSARMYYVSRKILRNHEDAEDNVQNSLWKAYEKIGQFEGRARFSTWLFRIAANEALMQIRSRAPVHKSIDMAKETGDDSAIPDIWDATPDAERRYIVRELTEKAFLVLKPATAQLFLRNQAEGWTQRELARQIGVTASAVKSRIFAAREQMQEQLRSANVSMATGHPLAVSAHH